MINPVAIIFWAFLSAIGYLIGGKDVAIFMLVVGMGQSLLSLTFTDRK